MNLKKITLIVSALIVLLAFVSCNNGKSKKSDGTVDVSKEKLVPVNLDDIAGKKWLTGDWNVKVTLGRNEKTDTQTMKYHFSGSELNSAVKIEYEGQENETTVEFFLNGMKELPGDFAEEAQYYRDCGYYVNTEGGEAFMTNNKNLICFNAKMTVNADGEAEITSVDLIMEKVK